MAKLRAVIVGCKTMGTKHLNCLRDYFSDEVEISGIINSSPESSRKRAEELGLNYFKSFDEITKDNTDIAIIATPASFHKEHSLNILGKGISCLVEKPFAIDEKECQAIIDAAKDNILMVGYIEIFNPAIVALKKELKDKKVKFIKALRTTISYGGNTDTTIIQNLMSHDISVMRFLANLGADDIKSIKSEGAEGKNMQSFAHVDLSFNDGTVADLTADIGPHSNKERNMTVIDEDENVYSVDFLNRKLIKNGVLIHEGGNPLQEELAHFIHCYKNRQTPAVDGISAMEVEKTSLKIDKDFRRSYQKMKNI